MTDWKEPTAEELISQMENDIQRISNTKIRGRSPYIISKQLYNTLKNQEND